MLQCVTIVVPTSAGWLSQLFHSIRIHELESCPIAEWCSVASYCSVLQWITTPELYGLFWRTLDLDWIHTKCASYRTIHAKCATHSCHTIRTNCATRQYTQSNPHKMCELPRTPHEVSNTQVRVDCAAARTLCVDCFMCIVSSHTLWGPCGISASHILCGSGEDNTAYLWVFTSLVSTASNKSRRTWKWVMSLLVNDMSWYMPFADVPTC